MNIVFDARVIQDHFPGIGRYALNLLAELPDVLRGDETLTGLYDPSARNTRLRRAANTGRWMAWRAPIFGVAGLTAALPVSASVAHFPYYLRPVRVGCPSITTVHDVLFLVQPGVAPSARARLANKLFNALAVLGSKRVIAVSHSAARDIEHVFPFAHGKMTVIAEAADPSFAPRGPQAQATARARFNLPDRFSLYLASNKPHKNLARLVEAWKLVVGDWLTQETKASISTNNQQPILVIAGHQDPRYPDAQGRARALGIERQVKFIGAVSDDDAAALYSACDLFVFPSIYEGFGLTPLEAMACGAPVACSNTSAMPEVVGDAALLFDPTKPDDIAAGCLRVLRDDALRAHMRARSLARAERFSWRDAAANTIALYREVARLAD